MEQVTELSYALDTFYFLVCGALVMWMAAGFTMLESGLVRAKNTAEILAKNVGLYAIACVMYMLCGYGIMYGGEHPYLPGLSMLTSADHSLTDVLASGGENYYSRLSDFFFQVVFVATAMSIVSGSVAERMKLWSFFAFAAVMTGFIYPVQGYWKWGGGFLDQAGFMDFAGSGVVHMAGASAALTAVLLLGARKGKYGRDGQVNAIQGCNLPLATLGMLILWLGWFGFNGGSQLKLTSVMDANAVALVFVNTNMAAAGGLLAALLTSKFVFGKADLTMILNGALAGLVAITAEPLAPSPVAATLIGAVGGVIVFFSVLGLDKLRIDDPVGAISVHGAAGLWGLIAVVFSQDYAQLSADRGTDWGMLNQLGAQLLGIGTIAIWVLLTSGLVWFVLKKTVGIRVSEEEEYEGLDLVECGLEAYPEFRPAE